jgi:hypothetical protein
MREPYAQLEKKIYFWWNPRTQHIYQGAPPEFDSMRPFGYETITCNTAHEAELWSERLRQQDKVWDEANRQERDLIEGRIAADIRREINDKLSKLQRDSLNPSFNAWFLKEALRRLDEFEKKGQFVRESYLHKEGYEDGH